MSAPAWVAPPCSLRDATVWGYEYKRIAEFSSLITVKGPFGACNRAALRLPGLLRARVDATAPGAADYSAAFDGLRDYRDVSPTSGTFSAPYNGQLTCSKRAGLIQVEYTNGETLESRRAI